MRVKPKLIILSLKKNHLSVPPAARECGIHRSTVYRWKTKAQTGWGLSSKGLKRKSTTPHHLRGNILDSHALSQAISLRKLTGWTSEKIISKLKLPVSSLTLHRKFKKLGYVRKYGYHRRPLFQNTGHMNAQNTTTIGAICKWMLNSSPQSFPDFLGLVLSMRSLISSPDIRKPSSSII